MKAQLNFILPVILLGVIPNLHLHAQSTAFTYQGSLSDNSRPAQGFFDLRFSLWDSASGPSQVGDFVTVPAVETADGLFTVDLDFGADVFNGDPRWLEIAVGTNGDGTFTTLTPRQPLTSTPYAIRAAHFSGTVQASQLSGTLAAENIGEGSITSLMLAQGAVGSNQLASSAVTTAALEEGAVTAEKMITNSEWSTLSLANHSLSGREGFGWSAAPIGSDHVIIGAQQGDKAAHLYNINGTLITAFNAPPDYVSWSVAAVGTDRVLLGARWGGIYTNEVKNAFLFSTNGTLLSTFVNPAPTNTYSFGMSLAALGTEAVLIGSIPAAYLFNTNGTLITTFTNPAPTSASHFHGCLVAVGSDKVLIGDDRASAGTNTLAGAAHLFSTNGVFLTTITNPTPEVGDEFGFSGAALGSDRMLISAPFDSRSAPAAGAVYLFSTNGTLLSTITNPSLQAIEYFGWSVAAMGDDRVLVGAIYSPTETEGNSTTVWSFGAAYLFDTNGTLLTTFTNPAPNSYDLFGYSLAAVSSDHVLIGTPRDDTGATDAGAAYLFSLKSYTPDLVAEGVKFGSVTLDKLDSSIGLWTRSGNNVYRQTGNVGIGTASPRYALELSGSGAYDDPGAATFVLHNRVAGQRWQWHALDDGSFQIADVNAGLTRLIIQTNGNVEIGGITSIGDKLEVNGSVGATAFNTTSDRAAKEDFSPVDPQDVLAQVLALPVSQWRFKEDPGPWHLGPMAQDFQAAFDLGADDKHIATVDADGVVLAAIQALNQELADDLKTIDTENAELRRTLGELKHLIHSLGFPSDSGTP